MVAITSPTTGEARVRHPVSRELSDIVECPEAGEPIRVARDQFIVPGTGKRYSVADGIPNLFVPNTGAPEGTDVTELVKRFYEETPFPNYDDFDSRESLAAKAQNNVFAAMLDAQIPKGAVVLEAGCGTGQLTNFLGMSWTRRVFGGDICLNSLRLAKAFRDRYSIRNAAFLQIILFHPPFRDERFDLIISSGVLHHTGDPESGMAGPSEKVEPGRSISS